MDNLLQSLLKLQTLDFSEAGEKKAASLVAELRSKIPQPILAHYDRLRARGKKGLAAVRNQVCAECHMRIPLGTIMTIMHGTDIQLCGSCGRYLYLPEPVATNPAPPAPPVKPPAKPRKRKNLSHAT